MMDDTEGINDKNTAILLYLLCGLLTLVFCLIDLSIPLGVAGGVPYITVVLLSQWLPSSKHTVIIALVCSCLTILGFYYSPPGGELWKVLFNRGLALYAIWVTALILIQKRILEEKRENAKNDIKTLRGLLPICASCKKIRDDNGYWNQIEQYISDHSEADFSHSICPECSNLLYPEFSNNKVE